MLRAGRILRCRWFDRSIGHVGGATQKELPYVGAVRTSFATENNNNSTGEVGEVRCSCFQIELWRACLLAQNMCNGDSRWCCVMNFPFIYAHMRCPVRVPRYLRLLSSSGEVEQHEACASPVRRQRQGRLVRFYPGPVRLTITAF
jgi:hypothetical protein